MGLPQLLVWNGAALAVGMEWNGATLAVGMEWNGAALAIGMKSGCQYSCWYGMRPLPNVSLRWNEAAHKLLGWNLAAIAIEMECIGIELRFRPPRVCAKSEAVFGGSMSESLSSHRSLQCMCA